MKLLDATGAGLKETLSFFPRLIGIFQQLWNEVIGFVFFAMALFFTFNANGVVESFQALDRPHARSHQVIHQRFRRPPVGLLCGLFRADRHSVAVFSALA